MIQQKNRTILFAGIIALIGLAAAVVALIWRIRSRQNVLLFVCVGLFYAAMLYYGLKGYRTPHGNMVQIMMLILAVYVAASTVTADNRWGFFSWIPLLASNLAAVFMGFMAGRLNKIEENKTTAKLVSVLLCVRCVWFLEDLNMGGTDVALFVLDRLLALLMWTALVLLYFFRFEEHKKAGE